MTTSSASFATVSGDVRCRLPRMRSGSAWPGCPERTAGGGSRFWNGLRLAGLAPLAAAVALVFVIVVRSLQGPSWARARVRWSIWAWCHLGQPIPVGQRDAHADPDCQPDTHADACTQPVREPLRSVPGVVAAVDPAVAGSRLHLRRDDCPAGHHQRRHRDQRRSRRNPRFWLRPDRLQSAGAGLGRG